MHKKKQQLKSTLESVLKKNHTLSYIRQGQNYANNLISDRARRARAPCFKLYNFKDLALISLGLCGNLSRFIFHIDFPITLKI